MSIEQHVGHAQGARPRDWRSSRRVPAMAFRVDAAVIVLTVMIAALVRNAFGNYGNPRDIVSDLAVFSPLMLVSWLLLIWSNDGYRRSVLEIGTEEFRRVALASALTLGLLSAGCFLFHADLSRGFLAVAFAVGLPGLMGGRLLIRVVLHRARRNGSLQHKVVIAGSDEGVRDVARVLRRESRLGFSLVGALVPSDPGGFETSTGIPVLGSTDDTCAAAIASGADTLFLAHGAVRSNDEMRTLVWELEDHEIDVVVAPNVSDISHDRVRIRPVGGLPLVHIERPRLHRALRSGKRVFDVVASVSMIIAASPVLLYAAYRVHRFDKGPVLFRQSRVGRDGVEFSCLKFRSMVTNAEALLERLHSEQGFDGGLFKMEHDPRITAPGRWLRKFSVDELPQLFNVLRGEMSLVGPRPPLPSEVARYDPHAHRRLRVRPGLTGLWQVSGRSELSFDDAIRLDLYYVDNWSIFQDLSILLKTFGAVFRSRGAY